MTATEFNARPVETTLFYDPRHMDRVKLLARRNLSVSRVLKIALEENLFPDTPIERRAVFICEIAEKALAQRE